MVSRRFSSTNSGWRRRKGPEEVKESFASLNQDEPQASPLTPAVQQDVLSSRRLPPATLPSFATRMPGSLSSDTSTHLRSAKALRTDHDTDLRSELQEVLQQNRALEEHQAALLRGAAPTSPPPMSHGLPNSGLMSPLTVHQPFPSMPTGDTRGPWSTTRDRIFNNNNSNITRELLFHQEFRVVNPHLDLFQGELVPECLAFPILQPSEWPIRLWLLRKLLWYHPLRCQKMTSRERSCLSLSFR